MLTLWRNARIATCDETGRVHSPGAVVTRGPLVEWVGDEADLPTGVRPERTVELAGRWVTPGLIDCHTHLVFAGERAAEFARRTAGESYAGIAREGGGILGTMRATRAATEDELLEQSRPRLESLLQEGVTTVEIKSGYGLTLEDELKLLRTARHVGESLPLTVHATLLAAHAVPPEYQGRAEDYVSLVTDSILPAAASEGLADSVDAFCERIAFTPAQVRRVFERAQELGLPVRLHAEQLSNSQGAALAASLGALSADHLEWLDEDGAAAMAAAGTVAVLLPGAFYFLRETRLPPVALLRERGVPMAVASDFNPGSSPLLSLRLAMNMACVLFGLTPEESLAGVTRCAAQALGLTERGVIAPGMRADLVLWDAHHPAELAAQFGTTRPRLVLCGGQPAA
jgi:imidazolonepropionase